MKGDEWLRIRRVGGEGDPAARVVVEFQPAGTDELVELGSEPLAGPFSTEWNLAAYRRKIVAGESLAVSPQAEGEGGTILPWTPRRARMASGPDPLFG